MMPSQKLGTDKPREGEHRSGIVHKAYLSAPPRARRWGWRRPAPPSDAQAALQFDRDRQLFDDEFGDGLIRADGPSQVAPRHLPQPREILDGHGVVEAVLRADKGDDFGVLLLARLGSRQGRRGASAGW